jgi:hypothetical protein
MPQPIEKFDAVRKILVVLNRVPPHERKDVVTAVAKTVGIDVVDGDSRLPI